MRKISSLIFIVTVPVLSFMCMTAYAQDSKWSGKAEGNGATNFGRNNTEALGLQLKYKGDSFRFGANISANHSFQPSSEYSAMIDLKKSEDMSLREESKEMSPRKIGTKAVFDFGFDVKKTDIINLSVGTSYDGKEDSPDMNAVRYLLNGEVRGHQLDSISNAAHSYDFTAEYIHLFPKAGSRIVARVSSKLRMEMEDKYRLTEGELFKPKCYATAGSLNDIGSLASVYYEDASMFGIKGLKTSVGVDFNNGNDIDLYEGWSYRNGQRRDSTELHQSYYYYSLAAEPYINAVYTLGRFDFSVKERVQIYNHALVNELDKKTDLADPGILFDKTDVKNLLGASVAFRVNDRNRLGLGYDRTISRPDYKKLCNTLVIGASEGEYIMGNPDLKPETIDNFKFDFSHIFGHFVTKFNLNCKIKKNTAEKVLEKDPDETLGIKTLYTWVNTKQQVTYGSRLACDMNADYLTANIWAAFNYDVYLNQYKVNKQDFNYELGTSISASIVRTLKLTTSIAYISARRSLYTSKGEDLLANIRLSQTIIKGLDVYLDINNIVDKDIYEENWNEEMTFYKVKTSKLSRRALILGLAYKF